MLILYFIFLISPQDLRAPLADRRETLQRDQHLAEFYNASPKNLGPKTCNFFRFYTTSDFDREYPRNETRNLKSERHVTENDSSCVQPNKSGELWSTIQKVGHVSLDPAKWTCSGDNISARGGAAR